MRLARLRVKGSTFVSQQKHWRNFSALGCEDAARLASESHDRRLTLVERLALRLHLAACAACRRMRSQLAAVEKAARRLAGKSPLTSEESAAAQDRIAAGLRNRLGDQ